MNGYDAKKKRASFCRLHEMILTMIREIYVQ